MAAKPLMQSDSSDEEMQETPQMDAAEDESNEPGGDAGDGSVKASPYEEHLLGKVMGAVYQALNSGEKMRQIEHWLLKTPNVGATIGNIAFTLLASIFKGAEQSGVKLPVDVFFAQGGAVYQTIERIMLIAKHGGVPMDDEDKVREDAMGVLVDKVRAMFGDQMKAGAQGQQQAPPQGAPPSGGPPDARPMNPMAAAVGQGLQQQGLMGG